MTWLRGCGLRALSMLTSYVDHELVILSLAVDMILRCSPV